ncbi:MAG: hypothetical protein ACKV22_16250 [Bryobacteraceae bacterium]
MTRVRMLLIPALMFAPLVAQEFKGPAAAGRGYAIFHDASKPGSCGNCHLLGGKGTAAGPDLSRLARLNPRGIKTAIMATRTQYVQAVKTKAGETFPGFEKSKTDKIVEYFDLSKQPPQLRKFEKAEISGTQDNSSWKHPAEAVGYTAEQLADILSYLRFASYGDTKGVTAEEVE